MRDLIYEVEGLLPKKVVVSIREQLHISEDIDSEVDKAAAQFGFYAVLSEKAESRYQKLKFAYERWQANTEATMVVSRARENKKAFTEAQMKAHVRSQPKYGAYQVKLIEYDEHRRILKVIAKAFELKKDLVQTKSSNRRKETR